MDNKQFRDAIYSKYEYQLKNNNDDFFNTHNYKKNTKNILFNKVAVFFICTLLMGSVVYAGTMIYQYFTQKTSQADYIEDMSSWFEINNQETHYKKISSYEEYMKYKDNWPSIIDMKKEEFEDNFLIVVIASWRMPGISIANISADDNTLYVELESNVTEEIKQEEYMVSAKVLKELDRENISVKEIVKEIKSDKYEKLENIPFDYNIESAKQDGCIIVNDNKISSEDEERLEKFIENKKNEIEDYIRIFRRNEIKENGEEIIIIDIEYRDGEYILYMDETRSVLPGDDKAIKYLGTFQNMEIRESKRYTGVYLNELTGTEVCVAIY